MANQHTVPAVYLAGFSDDRRPRSRESVLWVGRRCVPRIFQKKAERIGVVPDQYKLNKQIWASIKWDPSDLDAMWATVERGLATAVDTIIRTSDTYIDANMWLSILAEFAAHIFVRGSDFRERFLSRFPSALETTFDIGRSDHINAARLLELHRLRGATRRASWTILHAGNARFITNDCCRTPFHSKEWMGYVIPLRLDAALELSFSPTMHQPMAIRPGPKDTWVVGPIRHVILDEQRVAKLNELLANAAIKEIYGSPESHVNDVHARMSPESPPWEIVEPTLLLPFRDMGDSRAFETLVVQVQTKPSAYHWAANPHV